MQDVWFDRDETPRGERECGGRLAAFTWLGLYRVWVLRQGLMPEGSRRCRRLDASARKRGPVA
jgi:hypothetical protein